MQRRQFLQWATQTTLSFAALPTAHASPDPHAPRLLVLLLRGGMDGLTAVPPLGDPHYDGLRPTLNIRKALPLNNGFGLHPSLSSLHDLWLNNQLAIVHCTGFAYRGRSHFEGQDVMQSGLDRPYTSRTGWLGRAMQAAQIPGGVSISIPMPLLLRGNEQTTTQYPNWMPSAPLTVAQALPDLWANDDHLKPHAQVLQHRAMNQARQALKGQAYTEARSLPELARLAGEAMSREDGPRVGLIDFNGGFDTHANQGAEQGTHADQLNRIHQVVHHFQASMGTHWRNALVLTLTEFGRTAAENGTTGTDHGWGTCCFLAGGLVRQSQVYADWRGLQRSKLHEERDLPATIDVNAVHARVIERVFELNSRTIQSEVVTYRDHAHLKCLLI
jgi:uncharacterized protein (DUF1501 family)